MLRPLTLPDGAPEEAQRRAAEFALGATDVARMFGVTKQTVYEWSRGGRLTEEGFRTVLPSLQAPGGRQEPLRYRLADVDTFAREHKLTYDVKLLELELQKRLAVGAFDPALPVRATAEDELISESAAARQLGMSRSTLHKQRTEGKLNPAIRIEGASYSQIDIFRVLEGELELRLEVPE